MFVGVVRFLLHHLVPIGLDHRYVHSGEIEGLPAKKVSDVDMVETPTLFQNCLLEISQAMSIISEAKTLLIQYTNCGPFTAQEVKGRTYINESCPLRTSRIEPVRTKTHGGPGPSGHSGDKE